MFFREMWGVEMKYVSLFIMVFFISFLLADEVVEPVEENSSENIENVNIDNSDGTENSTDLFIDEDGDGIADGRTFRERMRSWRRTRSMSDKIKRMDSENSDSQGKFGDKAKQGGQGNGPGNNPGNGHG